MVLRLVAVIGLLAVVYVAALLFAPGLLPDGLRIGNSVPTPGPPNGSGGGRISFIRSSQDSTKRDLLVVNADGTNQQQLTHDLYIDGGASWSPDGSKLIVQANISGVSTVVRITVGPNNQPADAVQLTADIKADSVLPVWSPDGKMVAFQSKRDGGDYQLFVMDADGNNKRRVSDGKGYAGQPAWSPDGKSIAYIAGQNGTAGAVRDLYTVGLNNEAPKQITNLNSSLGTPVWSPDSESISFVQIAGDQDFRVMIALRDGTSVRTLAQNGVNRYQQFSPSGDELVYSNVLQGHNGIYRVRVSDGISTTVRTGDDYQPAWSPDGKQLTWSSSQQGSQQHKIVVAGVDGSDLRIVSQGDGDDYQPSWSIPK